MKILSRKRIVWFALLTIVTGIIISALMMNGYDPVPLIIVAALVPLLFYLIRWLRQWRNFRRFLFGVAAVITLIALIYTVENFRGKRAWENYRQAAAARGEKFDVASIAPPPVPDDRNFAMQPIWVEQISATIGVERGKTWYGDRVAALGHTNLIQRLQMPLEIPRQTLEQTNQAGNWQVAKLTDLRPWQAYYRQLSVLTNYFPATPEPQYPAADVLLALSRYTPPIEELRGASKLPYARFPLGYADANSATILLPHLAALKGIAKTLQLRAIAELHSSQSHNALEDIRLMLRLNDAIRIEPFLISHLVNIAILQIELQPIWEGLADRRWNAAQLSELDAELARLDFLADFDLPVRGGQAFAASVLDYLQRNRKEIAELADSEGNGSPRSNYLLRSLAVQAIPRGWFEQNKISMCRVYSQFFSRIIAREKRIYSTATAAEADAATVELLVSKHPYNWFARQYLPALQAAAKKFVYAQTITDLARVAIALERHRLAHGDYPAALGAIAPDFLAKLPHDIVTGQPLKYRRTDDGSFILYSVGWNETDDGGTVALTKGGGVDPQKGDWVWRYPQR